MCRPPPVQLLCTRRFPFKVVQAIKMELAIQRNELTAPVRRERVLDIESDFDLKFVVVTTLQHGGGRQGLRQTRATLRDVWGMPNLRRFLVAFFIYMDGVITVVYFAARYAKTTLGFDSMQLIGMLAIVQVTALVGSVAMARPTDKMGPRWVVCMMLLWWGGVAVAAYLAESKEFFLVVAGLAGLGLGSIQAASRAFMARLIPKGRESEMFGFYALCGKTGSIAGPLVFGIVTALADGNQRPGVLAVGAFYLLGYLVLRKVSDEPVS